MGWGVSAPEEEVETGVSVMNAPPDPTSIDINTMSTEDFLSLSDWQWTQVLTQIVAELGATQRKRAELAPYFYEYKGLQEKERNLTSMKSAVQSIMRTNREV